MDTEGHVKSFAKYTSLGVLTETRPTLNFCAKMLVNAKIKRLVTSNSYADDSFIDLFQEAGIEFELHKKPPSQITHLLRNEWPFCKDTVKQKAILRNAEIGFERSLDTLLINTYLRGYVSAYVTPTES